MSSNPAAPHLELQALFGIKSPTQVMQEAMTAAKAAVKQSKASLADRKAGLLPGVNRTPVWTRKALVLPVRDIECASCGNHMQAPAGPVMVKSTNPRKGTMLTSAEPGAYSPDMSETLPRELSIKHETVSDCPRCFDLCNRLYEACNGFAAQVPSTIQMRLFQ